MTSRIPPSRRSPDFAVQRAAKVVQQQTPGAGRVAGVAKAGVSQAVAAAIRGKAAGSPATLSADGFSAELIHQGTAEVMSDLFRPGLRVPAACTLTDCYLRLGLAPTGSGLTVLVKRSGSTLATLTASAGSTTASATGLSVSLAAGDILTHDVTAVGSTIPGADIAVAHIAA